MPGDPNRFRIPSPESYKRALLGLLPIHDNHLAMLKANYQAPDHSITASQLAAIVGYQNFNAVNLQYGLFADKLCRSLGKHPDCHLSILATFEKDGLERQEHWKLVLRPEVVEALGELGWFEGSAGKF
jgi:hypothetical protein